MNYLYQLCRPGWRRIKLAGYRRQVQRANELESSITKLDSDGLSHKMEELRTCAQSTKNFRSFLPLVLAVGRELSQRTLGMRHYDVQLIGALALYDGLIAEMDTGEGKTLMAPLAAFLRHLEAADQCTHIVTANEYLAARDAQWMKPLYQALGMSVGLIVPAQAHVERVRAYQNHVVYAAAKEIVFDSLREPLRRKKTSSVDAILRPQPHLQLEPKYDFAIVDEVDSVLIDQASSPMHLGSQTTVSPQLQLYRHADVVAGQLIRGTHYRLLHDDRKVELIDQTKAELRHRAGPVLRLLPPGHSWYRYVTCALAARHIYKRDQHYVVREDKIILIDESTGRMLPGRQLPDGIHQALEVHNGIIPSAELRGSLMTTFQTFFRQYNKLAGMTGTASEAAWEFCWVYNLKVLPLPPNKPSRRQLLPDRVYRYPKRKYFAVLDEIEKIHATGRPLLVATGSVKTSEQLSQMLHQKNLPHEVLNAKNHAREAEIIAQAGQTGRITVITNMAGRGVDIVLGDGVAGEGGIFLLATDRLPFRRLDHQLAGRIGRQGDPGQCQFFLSLGDDLIHHAPRKKTTRLRLKTRRQKSAPIHLPESARLFEKQQGHFDKLSSSQRRKVCRAQKQREKLKAEGLWEDWMDMT